MKVLYRVRGLTVSRTRFCHPFMYFFLQLYDVLRSSSEQQSANTT